MSDTSELIRKSLRLTHVVVALVATLTVLSAAADDHAPEQTLDALFEFSHDPFVVRFFVDVRANLRKKRVAEVHDVKAAQHVAGTA